MAKEVIVITGTSRGLGFALAELYLKQGATVIGVARNDPSIESDEYFHLSKSITNDDFPLALEAFLRKLRIQKIDILINNAGVDDTGVHLSKLDPSQVLNLIDIHCVGALRTIKGAHAFLDKTKIVNVTSRLGSIIQTKRGDFSGRSFSYGYRIAKCAQNMLSLCLDGDTELGNNIILSINPGLLLTNLGASDANFTAWEGAKAVMQVVKDADCSGIYHAFGDEALY